MKRILATCILILFLTLIPILAAEETTTEYWHVWLQNDDGRIITLDNEGKRENIDEMPEFKPHDAFVDTFIPTGEHVQIDNANTLTVHDPFLPGYFPFITDVYTEFTDIQFVENGQKLLAQTEQGEYILMSRDGEQTPLNIPDDAIHTTIKGFLCINAENQLIEYNTSDDTQTIIWEGDGQAWQILGVDMHPRTYGPFLQWQQVAPPVIETPSRIIVAPTPLPTPDPIFHIGDTVRVQTIDGEVLYLRDEPLTGEIIFHLLGGMRVELIGGPVDAGDYRWWNIQMRDGTAGWAAQAVDDVTTLLPLEVSND